MGEIAKFPKPQSFDDEIEMVRVRQEDARKIFDFAKLQLTEHQMYKAAVGKRLSPERRAMLEEYMEQQEDQVAQAARSCDLYDSIFDELVKASSAKDEVR